MSLYGSALGPPPPYSPLATNSNQSGGSGRGPPSYSSRASTSGGSGYPETDAVRIIDTRSNTCRHATRVYHTPNYAPSSRDEQSLLIPININKTKHVTRINGVWIWIALFMGMSLASLLVLSFPEASPSDPDWNRHRRECEIDDVKCEQDEQHRREDRERQRDEEQRREERQRQRKEQERKRREERERREREGRQRMGLAWDTLRPAMHCSGYGARRYSARLWNIPLFYDWMKVCQNTEVTIHGVVLEKPDYCEDLGIFGGVIGHWTVNFNEAGCLPFWGSFSDEGCTARGSGTHRVHSRLWNIHMGENWMRMCSTTPADFHGKHFDNPTYCVDKGFWGAYGVWDYHDQNC